MVVKKAHSESRRGYILLGRIRSDNFIEFIKRNNKRCDIVKIESDQYVFESADDIQDNWHLIKNSNLSVEFELKKIKRISSYFEVYKNAIIFFAGSDIADERSRVIADDVESFAKSTFSYKKSINFTLLFGLAVIFILISFVLAYQHPYLDVSFKYSGFIVLVLGLLLIFNARKINNYFFPVLYHPNRTILRSIVQPLVIPMIVNIGGGLIVWYIVSHLSGQSPPA